ncbi:hypothetical protein [Glycomyces tenuis]|uniref:hypothetical protein n=1 Tax=Glycomyces tenuis TaxID=58116 RepID=UPI0004119CDB|nr:hypothetical protein [Glycomyces tenuis]
MSDDAAPVTVTDRVQAPGWFGLALGIATLIVTPLAMIGAGSGTVHHWNRITMDYDIESWAWTEPLYMGTAALGFSLVLVIFFLRRPKVLHADAEGARLHGKGNARAKWEELDRVVVWRRRVRRLGFIPGWRPQVGLVRDTERTRAFQRAADAKRWGPADLRDNGVPEWLPGGIQKHSARLSHRRAPEVAAAVARFAPHLRVVDERFPDRSEPVTPPGRS